MNNVNLLNLMYETESCFRSTQAYLRQVMGLVSATSGTETYLFKCLESALNDTNTGVETCKRMQDEYTGMNIQTSKDSMKMMKDIMLLKIDKL